MCCLNLLKHFLGIAVTKFRAWLFLYIEVRLYCQYFSPRHKTRQGVLRNTAIKDGNPLLTCCRNQPDLISVNLSFPHCSHTKSTLLQFSRPDQMGQNLLHAGEQSDEGEHAASVRRWHHQGGDWVTAWRNGQVGLTYVVSNQITWVLVKMGMRIEQLCGGF